MNFTGKRKILFTIPAIIIIIGIISTIVMGFNLDIDFSGGTEITISMGDKEYSDDDIKTTIEDACGHDVSTVQKMDNGGVLVKLTDYLKDDENKSIKDAFKEKYGLEDGAISITAVSATIGNEMVGQSILLCIITVILMLAYITYSRRAYNAYILCCVQNSGKYILHCRNSYDYRLFYQCYDYRV